VGHEGANRRVNPESPVLRIFHTDLDLTARWKLDEAVPYHVAGVVTCSLHIEVRKLVDTAARKALLTRRADFKSQEPRNPMILYSTSGMRLPGNRSMTLHKSGNLRSFLLS
jgi:hypothetical protein